MSGDTFNTTAGQIGAVGPDAHVHNNTFQQLWNQSSLDLPKLAEELERLRGAMKREAEEPPGQDEAVGAVAAAGRTAVSGDGPATLRHLAVLRHLKTAGAWALEIAEKIGVNVAAEAIKRAM